MVVKPLGQPRLQDLSEFLLFVEAYLSKLFRLAPPTLGMLDEQV